jgi:predicted CXXCH cytochrome family protein
MLLILVGMAILSVLPATSQAGVSGSVHDVADSTQTLCGACHIPHNALGDKLWAQTPSGTFTGVQDLCYTCHDGSPTSVGKTSVFFTDATKEHHKMIGTAADCSGDGACHDVHNQNATSGDFLVVDKTNGTFCETCHDDTPFNSNTLGDHTAGMNHYMGTTPAMSCASCHTIHGAKKQTSAIGSLTHPALIDDNNTTYYGDMCIDCHNGVTMPTPFTGYGGGPNATDTLNYAEDLSGGAAWKHPTTTTATTNPVGGCNKCHDPHDPDAGATPPKYLLKLDNKESAFCADCHTKAGAPQIGANTHFTGAPSSTSMNSGTSVTLPWANQLDDDGTTGADYATATANKMICETCHSVHRNGQQLTGYGKNLRRINADSEICQECHTDN